MEINKAIEAAIKAISYNQLSVKATYKAQRRLDEFGKFQLLRPTFRTQDIEIVLPDRHIPVRLFFPHKETESLILFFHGGGWVTGDVDSYNRVCAVTARQTNSIVASVDYRLAPEHPFPAGLMDCYEAAKYLFCSPELLSDVAGKEITLMGDSAGGNLAAAVSLMARDNGSFMPKRQILIYPAAYNDHSEKSPYPSIKTNGTDYILTSQRVMEYMELYSQNPQDRLSPYYAPLLAKDFSNQPDTLVITAEFDPLRDEGEDYGQRLKNAGNRVEIYRMMQAIHGFFSLPAGARQVKESYKIINSFLNEVPIGCNEKTAGLDQA